MWILVAIGGILLCLCIAEWIREVTTFQVTHYAISSPKLQKIDKEQKILFLSDLHSYTYGKGNQKLLEAIRKQKPALIFIGGDMMIGIEQAKTDVAEELILQLAKDYPVYYANGNHEQRMKIYPELYGPVYEAYRERLIRGGVHFLENESADLMLENVPLRLYGLEIPAECYGKWRKTTLSVEEVQERIGQAPKEKYSILLAHNPKFMDTYLTWGADLILSGHLHGGVVRLPKLGGVISPQGILFPPYSGEHTKVKGQDVVVSKGLGVHTIRLRFFNPAELIVLHLKADN